MQRSELDDMYSLSSKFTNKEMYEKMPGAEKISRKLQLELNKYIDPFTGKVNNELITLREMPPV